jgi:hypothetical protein
MYIVLMFQAVRSLAPPAPRTRHGGGVAACQQYLPGPHIKRQKAMCCDSVAMRAVSRPCELKSLRNERWRWPLSRREIGERRKGAMTRAENGAPVCTCNLLFGDRLSLGAGLYFSAIPRHAL